MTTATPQARRGVFTHIAGPAVIVIVALIMLSWSWETWPDPLVDYGTHLYVPWQLSQGHTLYRDIAYYNGPFSPYFNALMFRVGGVSIRTLVIVNLIILSLTMVLAYRVTLRASGRGVAIMGGLTFALVFAFGQVVSIGNYNWVTPYAHELTHGAAMGLAAIACVNRFHRRGGLGWIAAAGALLGAVFMTKAEPAAAAIPAVLAQMLAGWWCDRTSAKDIAKSAAILVGSVLVPPMIAWGLLAMAMPGSDAFRGVLGSWPWVFDRRVTSLEFYKNINGLNDVAGNLATMIRWCGVYLVLLGFSVGLGLLTRGSNRTIARLVPAILFVLMLAGLFSRFNQINWTGMITPLPLCLFIAICVLGRQIYRRPADSARLSLRLSLVVFSILLLVKMGLKPLAYHYGFVLAWPGTIVLIAAVANDLPAWISRRGGRGAVVRAVGLAAWIVAVSAILSRTAANFDSKRWTIRSGTSDAFRVNSYGLEVRLVCERVRQLVPDNGTVAVFPQGLMINYLTRRANPIRYVNFMPPEVLAVGEDAFVAELRRHPPDLIVINSSSVEDGHFVLDGADAYGANLLKWIEQNYQPIEVVKLPQPLPTNDRFLLSRHRRP